ncbi:hypothetical protein ACMD2_03661 [Ananas comosus]|uniref:Uncharacterized protein n=1 Tax=Ananas comosus TaxID=4615 RepID=A0A199UJK3_ANACO|nr:hypothetical protein ACMD2_03661 [Ananas comosus]
MAKTGGKDGKGNAIREKEKEKKKKKKKKKKKLSLLSDFSVLSIDVSNRPLKPFPRIDDPPQHYQSQTHTQGNGSIVEGVELERIIHRPSRFPQIEGPRLEVLLLHDHPREYRNRVAANPPDGADGSDGGEYHVDFQNREAEENANGRAKPYRVGGDFMFRAAEEKGAPDNKQQYNGPSRVVVSPVERIVQYLRRYKCTSSFIARVIQIAKILQDSTEQVLEQRSVPIDLSDLMLNQNRNNFPTRVRRQILTVDKIATTTGQNLSNHPTFEVHVNEAVVAHTRSREHGKEEQISAMAMPTNQVKKETTTHPHTSGAGPAYTKLEPYSGVIPVNSVIVENEIARVLNRVYSESSKSKIKTPKHAS